MSREGLILVLGDGDGAVADTLRDAEDLEGVRDLDSCLARMTALRAAGRPAHLVAVTADVPQPFAAGRRLRGIDRSVGLAFVVPLAEVSSTKTKLAFVPELTDVVVLASESPADLEADLRRAATDARQRARFARALDTMNQNLLDAASGKDRSPSRRGVSERYLAALTRHAPDAIISVDPHGCVVTINAVAAQVLGLADRDPEGQKLEELIRPDDPGRLHGMMGTVSQGGTQDRVEMTIRRPDRSRALLSVTAAPVLDEAGGVAGSVLLARDITEQRRTDERLQNLQRAESLATLAGGVAHDFNNLLVTVQGWVTLAAADPDDTETVVEALEHIRTASERAAELARAMLVYGGRGELHPQPCELSDLVDGMRKLFAVAVRKKIVVELDLADDLPEIQADDSQLRQVVMNLVTNAAEAIGDDAGTIWIRTRRGHREATGHTPGGADMPAGELVVLEVADSGPGMDEQTAARVFDPFFTTKFAGRGLGLAASLGIVRAHGGAISVHSSPGAGSRFRITFPVSREAG